MPFPSAIGFPHECIEAWLLAGCEPSAAQRKQAKKKVGFDPFRQPERLSHKAHVPKSAKAVWAEAGVDGETAAAGVRGKVVARTPEVDACGARAFIEALDRVLS